MVAHDNGDTVFFGNSQRLFNAFFVAEVFHVNTIDEPALDGVGNEVEVVRFGNDCFAAFFLRAEREEDGAVRQFLADGLKRFVDGRKLSDLFQKSMRSSTTS